METMQQIDLRNLDKSNWQTYRFDQIAKNISERVYPNNTDLEVYIGLEHIDSESIHIKRSGTPDDVDGQKLRFYPGDVIFGRRRAYQRKAAIATTDGFCSAHALVLRANLDVIDPQLFPFFLHSDAFMHRAVDISVGSLSPTINWGTLKHQEFLLPPKHQQSQLADLLWAMDVVVEKELNTLEKLKKYRITLHKKHFCNYKKSSKRIGDFTSKVGSGATPKGGSKIYQPNGVRFIRSQNVLSGTFSFDDLVFIPDEIDQKMSSSRVLKNDVLLNITGASIGRCAIYADDIKANVNQHVCIIRIRENVFDPVLVCEFINSEYGQNQVQLLQAGGNREGLNFSNIRMMQLPDYTYEEQIRLSEKYRIIESNRASLCSKINSSKSIQKSLINQIF
jgi:type I restriction enzyme S subunit